MKGIVNKKFTSYSIMSILLIIIGFFFYSKPLEPKNTLTLISNSQLQAMVDKKEDAIIYFGRPTCPQCQEFEPLLRKTLAKNKTSIYYYNTDEARKDNSDTLSNFSAKLDVDTVPTVIKLSKGKTIDKIVGIKTTDAIYEFIIK
ncbi:thioredoxin family protein [Enterococcus mundtii]|uniref:Thioredoxin n=1 Tax=Enterococcus mundtii TaxID=53346 RepID=A0A2S7RUY6_ENTMU|nr:thioredoxin family protein [Enterococcus mundtii]PQF23602.1 thioredoxin [Enterococcus mundtii]